MEWLKNNAVVVFIIIGLITYIEVRLSDLKSDLKADNRELRAELKSDIGELRGDIRELRADIKEIRSLLVTYILKNNSSTPLSLNTKTPDFRVKPQKMVHLQKSNQKGIQKGNQRGKIGQNVPVPVKQETVHSQANKGDSLSTRADKDSRVALAQKKSLTQE